MSGEPSRTQVLNDEVVSTMDTYISEVPLDVIYERTLLLNLMWGAEKMPGAPSETPMIRTRTPKVHRVQGRELFIPVAFNTANNVVAFTGQDTLPTAVQDITTTQRSEHAYYSSYAGIAKTEAWRNAGPSAIYSIWEARVDSELRALSDAIEGDLWSANEGPENAVNPKEVIGIQHLIDTGPTTGTVWNLNRATYTWQRNNADSNADTLANSLANLRSMWTTCGGNAGTETPNFMATTAILWNAYTAITEGRQQVTMSPVRQTGDIVAENSFDVTYFRNSALTWSLNCLSGAIYYLNTDYMAPCLDPGAGPFSSEMLATPNNKAMAQEWRVFHGLQFGLTRFDRFGVLSGLTDS